MKFNPFEDRKSRDVRNTLGHAFISSIETNSLAPFLKAIDEIEKKFEILPKYLKDYITMRKNSLNAVMNDLGEVKKADDFFSVVSRVLWNSKLFFEFHEWVEEEWTGKKGAERKVYQSLILSAIFYEHLFYNRVAQAEKVGKKASDIIKEYRKYYPHWIDTDLFLMKLKNLEYHPPVMVTPE